MAVQVVRGDARRLPLADESADLVLTSPPYYGLRSYTDDDEDEGGQQAYAGQVGAEDTPAEYLATLIEATAEWCRVLKDSGSLFVNLGDKYASGATGGGAWSSRSTLGGGRRRPDQVARRVADGRHKSLLGLPWRYAIACMDELGLILRAEIIWHKINGLPESVGDRAQRRHEHLFHLVKIPGYYAAADEVREGYARQWDPEAPNGLTGHGRGTGAMLARPDNPNGGMATSGPNPLGRLPGSVWDIPTTPLVVPAWLGVDHFAAFPFELPRRVIRGWSPPGICTACGEGLRPVTQASLGKFMRPPIPYGAGNHGQGGSTLGHLGPSARILGYSCGCGDAAAGVTRPSVVVDPFGGTGTTALVATVYGRDAITVDRSAAYCRVARWRTTDRGEIARAMEVPKPAPVLEGQGSLFDLEDLPT